MVRLLADVRFVPFAEVKPATLFGRFKTLVKRSKIPKADLSQIENYALTWAFLFAALSYFSRALSMLARLLRAHMPSALTGSRKDLPIEVSLYSTFGGMVECIS